MYSHRNRKKTYLGLLFKKGESNQCLYHLLKRLYKNYTRLEVFKITKLRCSTIDFTFYHSVLSMDNQSPLFAGKISHSFACSFSFHFLNCQSSPFAEQVNCITRKGEILNSNFLLKAFRGKNPEGMFLRGNIPLYKIKVKNLILFFIAFYLIEKVHKKL